MPVSLLRSCKSAFTNKSNYILKQFKIASFRWDRNLDDIRRGLLILDLWILNPFSTSFAGFSVLSSKKREPWERACPIHHFHIDHNAPCLLKQWLCKILGDKQGTLWPMWRWWLYFLVRVETDHEHISLPWEVIWMDECFLSVLPVWTEYSTHWTVKGPLEQTAAICTLILVIRRLRSAIK